MQKVLSDLLESF